MPKEKEALERFAVPSSHGAYEVVAGAGALRSPLLEGALDQAPLVAVLTQRRIWALHGAALRSALRVPGARVALEFLPEGERAKSPEVVERLWRRLVARGATRDSVVVAFGGGVTGDVAGFVAATLLRGVRWVNVPTTLLAQVDACLGGKVGINLPEGKNLVGAFWPPRLIVVDVSFLATLPARQVRAGAGEIAKYALGIDRRIFERCRRPLPGGVLDPALVVQCLRAKARIVAQDEHDDGVRRLLNLGHTVGHALEGARPGRWLHGEAVGLGLRFALRLALRLGHASTRYVAAGEALLEQFGLPRRPPRDLGFDRLLPFLRADKKTTREGLQFVLPLAPGRSAVVPHVSVADLAAVWRDLGA